MITIPDDITAKKILVSAFNAAMPDPTTVDLCDSIPGKEGYEVVAKILSAHFQVMTERNFGLVECLASVSPDIFLGSERARAAMIKTLCDSMRDLKLEEEQVIAACTKLNVPYDLEPVIVVQ